jgi:hypothetical protein
MVKLTIMTRFFIYHFHFQPDTLAKYPATFPTPETFPEKFPSVILDNPHLVRDENIFRDIFPHSYVSVSRLAVTSIVNVSPATVSVMLLP